MSLADTPSDVTLTVAAEELTARPNAPSFIVKESILDTDPKLLRKPFDRKVTITYRLKSYNGKPFDAKTFDSLTEKLLKETFRSHSRNFLSKFRSCKTCELIFSIFKKLILETNCEIYFIFSILNRKSFPIVSFFILFCFFFGLQQLRWQQSPGRQSGVPLALARMLKGVVSAETRGINIELFAPGQ